MLLHPLRLMSFNLRIHEDVIDVEINKIESRRVDSGVISEHRRKGHVLVVVGDTSTSGGTVVGIGSLNSKLQVEVARGDIENLIEVLDVDVDETLTVWDRHGGNRESKVSVEPENHLKIHL